MLARLRWINLGGGYLFDEDSDYRPFIEAVNLLKRQAGASGSRLDVFFEPGSALVRSAGYIVSTVLDVFPSDGKQIAVLDTTVNHMPEVLEYGFRPDVVGHDDGAAHEYLLAGSTCLAGDLFGSYRFERVLEVGDRVFFNNAGFVHYDQGPFLQRNRTPGGLRAAAFRSAGPEEPVYLRSLRRPLGGWASCSPVT